MADKMEYGYNSSEVEQYLNDIHSNALQVAKDAINDSAEVESAADQHWEGKAKDDWKQLFKKDKEHVCEQLDTLYDILRNEVKDLNKAMSDKDQNMMKGL